MQRLPRDVIGNVASFLIPPAVEVRGEILPPHVLEDGEKYFALSAHVVLREFLTSRGALSDSFSVGSFGAWFRFQASRLASLRSDEETQAVRTLVALRRTCRKADAAWDKAAQQFCEAVGRKAIDVKIADQWAVNLWRMARPGADEPSEAAACVLAALRSGAAEDGNALIATGKALAREIWACRRPGPEDLVTARARAFLYAGRNFPRPQPWRLAVKAELQALRDNGTKARDREDAAAALRELGLDEEPV